MNELTILDWIKQDFSSNPRRFIIEVIAWILSISCSITMAITVPNPPLIILYPIWITGCTLYAWAAWSRKSTGMLANYMLLASIDLIGLYRMMFI
jgi:hypothetical protein